ncbi:DUF6801 domain-containing protein [Streptomyces sp. TRM70308]|uniref:DUF6801 domain-containing protein n=1 Tax=Streptomyces sp. TRM70308 TaxID=3131932 RepID=UPI003D064FB1
MTATTHGRRTKAALAAAAVVAAAGAIGVAGAAPAAAEPASLTLNYSCPFPLIGTQELKVEISADLPGTIAVGEATPEFLINTVSTVPPTATQGLSLVGAKTIEGSAVADSRIEAPQGGLDLKVPVELEKTDVPTSGSFTIDATGNAPAITFSQPGSAEITVNDLLLTLTPRTAAGGETGLGTFDSACTLIEGQDNVLHTFEITGEGGGDGGADAGGADAGGADAGGADAGGADAGGTDAGGADAGGADAGGADAGGTDAGGADTGGADDGGTDAGGADDGGADAGGTDDGGSDAGGSGDDTAGATTGGTDPDPQLGGDKKPAGDDQLALTGAAGVGGLAAASALVLGGGFAAYRYLPRLIRRGQNP